MTHDRQPNRPPGKAAASDATAWTARIRRDHPRLFFNADTWPGVRERALGPERATWDRLRQRVDALPPDPPDGDHGIDAAAAAFAWRMTGDARYRHLAVALLERSVAFYRATRAAMKSVSWTSTTRINAWCAFDWLYDDLTDAQRMEIGTSFLRHVADEQPGPVLPPIEEWNWSGPETGFYGNQSLLWYAGLATFESKVDDDRARDFLVRGRDLFQQVLEHRRAAAGDDGGAGSTTLLYAFGLYPWAEFNFFHTWQSATGEDLAAQWPHVAWFANYVAWNWLPGARHFGAGDSYHDGNVIPLVHMWFHMAHIVHFYRRMAPQCASLARRLAEASEAHHREGHPRARSQAFLGDRDHWPCHRFLLRWPDDLPALGPAAALPPARHFEHMGQVFMRSGGGDGDTYALFTAGGLVKHHGHFDKNNLVLFHRGFLALDSGSRPNPGLHQTHYFGRTVAHNCVLIHMPGEQLPAYWGDGPAPGESDQPLPNDGGQNTLDGSSLVAFETSRDYTYAAGDATACYDPAKCALALRQVVFVPPGHFVVCDRVAAVQAEYAKAWLLHTAREPAIEGPSFSAEHEDGRLFCRTLLPKRPVLTKIGGPDRQFWCDGRNWPLPPGWWLNAETEPLGQWRVEVAPSQARADDVFLHLIAVGDRAELTAMTPCTLLSGAAETGVAFRADDRDVVVRFATDGSATGHIRIAGRSGGAVDRPLTKAVLPQAGLAPLTNP